MSNHFIRALAPRLAGIMSIIIVRYIPALEGAEEAVTSAILALWGVVEIALARNTADRRELIERDQRVLRAEGLYTGKIDGKYGPKSSAGVRGGIGNPNRK